MPTIECGLMTAKPDHVVMDTATQEGQVLQNAWSAVTKYPNGPQWSYGGVEPSNPLALWGFFEFDSVKHHEEFARIHGMEAVQDLPKILSSQEFQKHIEVGGDLKSVLDVEITEVLLVYFPFNTTDAEKAAIASKAQDVINSGLETCADAKASCFGWSVEHDFPILGCVKEEKKVGSVLAVFVGWISVDAAERYWEENAHEEVFEEIVRIKTAVEIVSRFIEVRKFGERET